MKAQATILWIILATCEQSMIIIEGSLKSIDTPSNSSKILEEVQKLIFCKGIWRILNLGEKDN